MVTSKNYTELMKNLEPGYYWAIIFGEWEIVQYAGNGEIYRSGIANPHQFEDFEVINDERINR